ncbi:MAG: hypothetical protein WHS43_09465 [Aquificaceae bacterium]|uniref:hypothetical protein n=1 Tax=Hydrogenobacter sp. Uz 6-8 TaxID=3384828 RepID=UPI0030ACFDDB
MKTLKKFLFLLVLFNQVPSITVRYLSTKNRHLKQPLRTLAVVLEFPYFYLKLMRWGILLFIQLLFFEEELRKSIRLTMRELGIKDPRELKEGKVKIEVMPDKDGKTFTVKVIRKSTE